MKILINGCGYIGKVHLKSICNYGLCQAAISDLDPQRLKETAQEFQITETYHSLEEALEHPFDGVVICTPNAVHKSDVEKCLKAGLNVMVEKPVSHTLEAADEICALERQYQRFVFVAYCLRFAPVYKKIKDYVQAGALGRVFGIRASVAGKKAITDAKTDYRTKRCMGGGVISDFSHEIDYSLWFAQKKVVRVQSVNTSVIHKDWDVSDCAELLLSCEDDLTISIHMDFLQPYFGRSIEIYGTQGAIRWRDNEAVKIYEEKTGQWKEEKADVDWDLVYRDEMVHYLDCLKTGKKPLIDAYWAREIMRIVHECNG